MSNTPEKRTITRFFPETMMSVVHQNGTELTTPTKGMRVHLHFRHGEDVPCCAEIDGGCEDHHATIGLQFEGKALSDFDGTFFLPMEVRHMLIESGFIVSEEFL